MDEVREQAERDYQLASGLSQDVESDDNVFRQTTARLPWLLIGMLGGIGNSMILGNFDTTFAAHPEMALYIPLIGGTGGNVGTQSSALVVQGLANRSLDAFLHILPPLFRGYSTCDGIMQPSFPCWYTFIILSVSEPVQPSVIRYRSVFLP